MYCHTLLILTCAVIAASTWSIPFHPVHTVPALRVTRYAPHPPPRRIPVHDEESERSVAKRDHDDYDNHHKKDYSGVIGPVHTFVKTDKNANYKWGVRHHVGGKFA